MKMTSKEQKMIFYTVAFLISTGICVGEKLVITDYCATLCPGCRIFYKDLFKPNYEAFIGFVDFVLVPFGFSEIKEEGGGKITLLCQHGPEECDGNVHQACALKVIPDEKLKLKYCVCVMTTDGVEAYKSCATDGIDFELIDKCVNSEDAVKYIKELGDMTNRLEPPLEYIPAMYINGKALSEQEEISMHEDFVAFICGKLTGEKPKCCEGKVTPSPSPPPSSQTSPEPDSSPSPSPSPPPSR